MASLWSSILSGPRTEVPPSLSGPASPKCPRNHSRARTPNANPRVGRRSPGRAHSCLASPSVVGGRVCGPPHAEGRVPGDHTGAAEGAALPGDHPLLRQRQGKKKKKMRSFSCFPLWTPSQCHKRVFSTRCLRDQELVTNCVSEGFVHAPSSGTSEWEP